MNIYIGIHNFFASTDPLGGTSQVVTLLLRCLHKLVLILISRQFLGALSIYVFSLLALVNLKKTPLEGEQNIVLNSSTGVQKFDQGMVKAGLFAVLGLCLLGNSIWLSGLTIFIIATVITEAEFLHMLAAIFCRDPNYFKYATERYVRTYGMGPQEINNKTENKIKEDESEAESHVTAESEPLQADGMSLEGEVSSPNSPHEHPVSEEKQDIVKPEKKEDVSDADILGDLSNDPREYYERVAVIALDALEHVYQDKIERNIKITDHKNFKLTADGMLDKLNEMIIFEVKVNRQGKIPLGGPIFSNLVKQAAAVEAFARMINQNVSFRIIYVGHFTVEDRTTFERRLYERLAREGISIPTSITFYTLQELDAIRSS